MQRLEARSSLNIHIKRKDQRQFAESLKSLKKEDFDQAKLDISKTKKLSNNSTINKLLSKVQSFSAHVQGSKASLKIRRRELFSYIIFKGMPEFFVTGNPADVHHPLLFHLGGEKINASLLMKKSSFLRASYAMKNPVLQAMFFDKIKVSFINYLMNYDRNQIKLG